MRHERFSGDDGANLAAAEARAVWNALLPRRGRAALRVTIAGGAAFAELAAVALTGLACEMAYHLVSYERQPELGPSLAVGLFLGLFVVLPNVARGEYSIENYLARAPHLRRMTSLWLAAWAVVLVLGFLSKTTGEHSRAAALATFLTGLPVLVATRLLTVTLVRRLITPRSDSARRIHLIGYEDDVASFYATHDTAALGLRVIGVSTLRDAPQSPLPGGEPEARRAQLAEDLDLSVSVVRFLRPDDVFVLVPWAEVEDLEACVDAFLRVPVALHLRPGRVMDRFSDVRVGRVGLLTGINVGRAPLSPLEIAAKRTFDVVMASLALVALSPLLVLIAALIRLDSRGPSLFRQKRYGFNQEAFWVFKFRSMRTEAGAAFRQATRDDDRITRIGRILRRTNLDELPQLLNVILGDMSLVGPRPHAVAHDRSFERRIALYARRLNVRPGITGWAQVNGLRGETLTDADMQRRVEHDLFYIDNWSLWFDLRILVMTVVARSAFRNAY
ncbi:exopolysaccharide biosynthesis polyprenyl glycosylphosphotransferase [Methylobacterium platani]|uniref:Exopolysaccharide biosynthesis polyprenyl glycosylphosphotransferase n=2 Tax=Methylobacterium platani TaxID=427683 RepID=A0A179SJM1_9HYPH|nr:exopolysaccharide biosynthesis polyprenyl glycosylphosphotransferase [Methylobacterium platani]KMO19353.1 exopolysaccharide biosynthesis polyprenyl glycosylphosphotransferase [Methylobacterium platani JCM 14648]OAS26744.1 exopolysaccharide biosynthesis polyprenyl glycosylphosphotransferase [Methylobacterium platani]